MGAGAGGEHRNAETGQAGRRGGEPDRGEELVAAVALRLSRSLLLCQVIVGISGFERLMITEGAALVSAV
jgi:hypothetical protein